MQELPSPFTVMLLNAIQTALALRWCIKGSNFSQGSTQAHSLPPKYFSFFMIRLGWHATFRRGTERNQSSDVWTQCTFTISAVLWIRQALLLTLYLTLLRTSVEYKLNPDITAQKANTVVVAVLRLKDHSYHFKLYHDDVIVQIKNSHCLVLFAYLQ